MAPEPALGKRLALERIRRGELPFSFGSPHAFMMALEQDGVFRIRKLEIDQDEAMAAGRESMAQRGIWTPEQHYALGKPVGDIAAEAASLDELAAKVEAMEWPRNW
jgi:hypothetical protein